MSDPRSLGPVQEDDPNEQTYRANLGQRGTPGYPATPGQSGDPGYPATPGQTPAPAPSPAFPGQGTSGNTGVVGPLQSPAGLAQGSGGNTAYGPAGTATSTSLVQHDEPAPTGTYDRSGFRDAWMSSGGKTPQDLANFVQQHQSDFGAGVQILPGGKGDRIRLPDGTLIDAVIGAGKGGEGAGWTGDPSQMGGGGPAGVGSGTGGAGGFGSGAGGGDFQNQIRQKLLDILGKAQTPVDENSAEVAQPFQAAQLQAQRGADAERKALAERLYAAGGGNVNGNELQQGMQQSAERMAVGLGGIKSQLIGRAVQAKQAQLQQALSLAVQSGDAESARAIQMQIAQMQNQYNYAQLAQQQGIWNDQYGLNKAEYEQNQNNNAVGGLT